MPEICRFFGIVIALFYNDKHQPHFHAKYGEHDASFEIETLRLLNGYLPPRVYGFVIEWAYQHQGELLDNWDRARRGLRPKKIKPLE
ncbi:MAG: DUF4160 domain-containing protein [Calditrichota bacterium]